MQLNLDLLKQDFFETYPQLRIKNPFKLIYDKFGTDSSQVMWAICLFVDLNSAFRTMDEKSRKEEIINNFLDKKHKNIFEDQVVQEVIKKYPEATMTEAQIAYKRWGDKLRERFDFIDTVEYTLDSYNEMGMLVKGTASQLDKMMADTHKLFLEFEKIGKSMDAEKQKGRVKGGRQETVAEKGLL